MDQGFHSMKNFIKELQLKLSIAHSAQRVQVANILIMVQKDRTNELGKLRVPSLVIQGDDDPLVPLAGGKATSEAIPNAKFMIVKGMGHVIPNLNAYWGDIKDAMISHLGKAT
ncbi:MAG: alpha/beta hydrolase [Desulfobacterales bacterium]